MGRRPKDQIVDGSGDAGEPMGTNQENNGGREMPSEGSTAWNVDDTGPNGEKILGRNPLWEGLSFEMRIYETVPHPTAPGKWINKFRERIHDAEIDDAWLQDRGYIGDFTVMRHWRMANREMKMQTGYYTIGKAGPDLNAQNPPTVTPGNGGGYSAGGKPSAGDFEDVEDRILRKMERYKTLFAPAAGAMQSGGVPVSFGMDALENSFKNRVKLLDEREADLQGREIKMFSTRGKKTEDDNSPKWIQDLQEEFLPLARRWIKRLTRDDDVGKDLRGELISNPKFREVWGDVGKKARVVEIFLNEFGDAGKLLAQFVENESRAAA